jgi:hypothetical protein
MTSWAWLPPVLYAESALATALAWAVYKRRPEHRPIAWLLTIGLTSDVALRMLHVWYFDEAVARLGVDTPWHGWPRVVGHVSDALSIAWPAAVAGAAVAAFLGRKPWAVLGSYVVCVSGFVVWHPVTGNGSQAKALAACELAATLVAVGCALTWYRTSTKSATTARNCPVFRPRWPKPDGTRSFPRLIVAARTR